jgi:hypothetical protein
MKKWPYDFIELFQGKKSKWLKNTWRNPQNSWQRIF